MSLKYDRRANEPLLRALEPDGFAHALVDYAMSGMFGFDLQFRSASGGRHATLYVGTTKGLDLHANSAGKYRLTAHKTYAVKKLTWDPGWSEWRTESQMRLAWQAIEQYVDRVAGHIAEVGTHLKEGVVQAAVTKSKLTGFSVLDREVAISYSNMAEKTRHLKAVAGPWLAGAYRDDAPLWWSSSQPTKPSTECDLLGLRNGQLLAIEIKPSSATASAIAWAPLQARQYASQIQSWVDEVGEVAGHTLTELMRQQQRVGTRAAGAIPKIDLRKPVKPIVIVDSRLSAEARERMFQVVEHLRSIGMDPGVDIQLTNLIGRVSPPIDE